MRLHVTIVCNFSNSTKVPAWAIAEILKDDITKTLKESLADVRNEMISVKLDH